MANIFQIVSSSEILQLDKEGRGEVTMTVTNLAKSAAARALVVPVGDTDEAWISIDGEEERELLAGTPEEIKIQLEVPKDAPEGELKFRIDVASEENPDDDFSEGPEITIKPAPASKLWLWILLAVLFLVIVAVVAWLVVSGGKDEAAPSEEPAVESVAEDGDQEGEAEDTATPQRFMPNLMGLSRVEAESQASAFGLTYEEYDGLGGGELTVSGHNPRPGQPIEEGGPVTFELSADMPDVVGMEEMEAGEALVEAGLWPGEVTYRASDRQEAGKILEQSIAPQVETNAGTTVDAVVSLGSCYWTPRFARDFGLMSCRSGSAISGLYCDNKNCGGWQLHCCPYLPEPDLDAKLTKSDWISPDGTLANRKSSFFDGLECRGSGCPKMRARYLETPRLKKGSDCRTFVGKSHKPELCGEGQYVAEFSCRGGRFCSEWHIVCCPGESIAP